MKKLEPECRIISEKENAVDKGRGGRIKVNDKNERRTKRKRNYSKVEETEKKKKNGEILKYKEKCREKIETFSCSSFK